MLRFIPIERPGGQREQARIALAAARVQIKEALGPDVIVGPIVAGGFEVETTDPDAEDRITEAVRQTAMQDEMTGGLLLTAKGAIVEDQPSADGSMLGL